MFEAMILPVVLSYARLTLRPVQIPEAVVQAWFAWSTAREPDLPPIVWAMHGVRRVRTGRDLPGMGTGAKDALHRSSQGAGMDGFRDHRAATPLNTLIHREELERIREAGGEVVELLMLGMGTTEVAKAVGVSPGRVSQIRREMMG